MKIVFADGKTLGKDCDLSGFEKFGQLTVYPVTSHAELAERVEDADIILTNKVVIDKEVMDSCKNLKYIGIAATGFNNVDIAYAKSKNITVTNVRGYSTDIVAQHTFALLFQVMEQISYFDSYVKSGDYSKNDIFTHLDRPFMEIAGKTWGIIGLGEIGRRVAAIAAAFGCRVIYYSTGGNNNNSDYERVDFDALLRESDIVSIHAPLNENTKGIMNSSAFDKMKKTAYLINVGRGPIVVDKDLAEAIDGGKIAGAGIDVFGSEPIPSDNPLPGIVNKERIVMTPHIAWASTEARNRLVNEMICNLEAFFAGEKRNVVN